MSPHEAARSPTLSSTELEIRIRYRERATLRWLLGLVVGIVLVVVALAIDSTGWTTLAIVGAYSLFALVMAVRSGILLTSLRS